MRRIAGGSGGIVLALALATNLLLHHWLFNRLSDAVGLYRWMTLVVFVLSIDFFVLCLVAACHAAYQQFWDQGLYRDLQMAAVSPWEAIRPFAWIVFFAVVADTAIEAMVGGLMTHDPPLVKLIGFGFSLGYGVAGAFFLGQIVLLFCLYRLPRTVQLLAVIALGFTLLLGITTCADLWQRDVANWSESGGFRRLVYSALSGGEVHMWRSFSPYASYYLAMGVAATVLGGSGLMLHLWVRKQVGRVYAGPTGR